MYTFLIYTVWLWRRYSLFIDLIVDSYVDIYQSLLRPVLFTGLKADPETLHDQTLQLLQWLDRPGNLQQWLRDRCCQTFCYSQPSLTQTLWGQQFANPIGLAAGFDKDGVAAGIWPDFGFGFAELGTVTAHAQSGNPLPRLFRLPLDQAALNRMGFNNLGAAALATRLRARAAEERAITFPLGINLGKSKITPLETAAADYVQSFQLLQGLGDYFVVNVSSPNTPGLRSLQAADQLAPILAQLQQVNQGHQPLLVKIAPDLSEDEIKTVIDLARKYDLAGMIATNTTIWREGLQTQITPITGNPIADEAGGISGKPVKARSTEIIRLIYRETQGQLPIIGVGGVFTAADAWEKITAGASLVQIYTGWFYEGPWMVRRILQGLAQRIADRGLASIAAAVGTEAAPDNGER
jgi:dihydroorotate dehydrogenase